MARPVDDIAHIVAQAIIDALKDREDELRSIAESAGEKAGPGIFGDVGALSSVLSLLFDVFAVANPEFALPIATVQAAEHAAGKSGTGFGIGYFLGYTLFQWASPYLAYITHEIADGAQSDLWDPDIAARLVAHRAIPRQDGVSDAHGGNLDTRHFDALVEDALTRPDASTLMTLLNLDATNERDVRDALGRHGYPDGWIEALFALRRYLLSPADLALANLRGAIDDDVMLGYAKQLGITPDDMQVLIANTGEPPGPEQLMEALRRGFIDDARFARGIRQSRVRNEWLDVEHALRLSPMTTSDAIRAVVENHLTDDEGQAIAGQNGLIPDHWRPLVESWGRPLSHEQMLTLFHRGQATLEEVQQAMRESDIKNKYINQAVELGRRLIPERTIVTLLHHGVVNHDTALTMLREQGFNDADAEALIKLGAAEATAAHKNLSRSDLVAMYEDGLMPKQQAITRLVALGYDHTSAVAALDLADFKANATKVKTLQRGIEASLKAKHLTPAEAISQLTSAGLDHAQAQRLVDQWLQQRGTRVLALSHAEIASAAYYGMITFDEAVAGIRDLGWSENDAKIIVGIRLRGLPRGVTVEPPAGN